MLGHIYDVFLFERSTRHICERIKLEPYKREVSTGEPQKITRDDCNKILTNTRNVITQEELDKFTAYRNGTYNGD